MARETYEQLERWVEDLKRELEQTRAVLQDLQQERGLAPPPWRPGGGVAVTIDHNDGDTYMYRLDQDDGPMAPWTRITAVEISEEMWERYEAFLNLTGDLRRTWYSWINDIQREGYEERQEAWAEYERTHPRWKEDLDRAISVHNRRVSARSRR